MGDDICYLVTVLSGKRLIRCALKMAGNIAPNYPMEPEGRKAIHAMLPLHVQSCGPVVEVEEIFEVHIV